MQFSRRALPTSRFSTPMRTTSPATAGDENMYAFPCWRTIGLPLFASTTWYKLESDVAKNTFPSATAGDCNYPAQVIKESPFLFAGCRIERVQIWNHDSRCKRFHSRSLATTGTRPDVNHRSSPPWKTPFLLSCRSVHGVEIAVPASEKQNAVCERGRGVHNITGFEFPTQIACGESSA